MADTLPTAYAHLHGWDREYENFADFDLPMYVGMPTFAKLPLVPNATGKGTTESPPEGGAEGARATESSYGVHNIELLRGASYTLHPRIPDGLSTEIAHNSARSTLSAA